MYQSSAGDQVRPRAWVHKEEQQVPFLYDIAVMCSGGGI